MQASKILTARHLRLFRLTTILTPPTMAGVCFLAGLEVVSIALFTVATGFVAALYSRRLYAHSDEAVTRGRHATQATLLKDLSNVVLYRGSDLVTAIGFYRLVTRPQQELLSTLYASVANSQLTPALVFKDLHLTVCDIQTRLEAFAKELGHRLTSTETCTLQHLIRKAQETRYVL